MSVKDERATLTQLQARRQNTEIEELNNLILVMYGVSFLIESQNKACTKP